MKALAVGLIYWSDYLNLYIYNIKTDKVSKHLWLSSVYAIPFMTIMRFYLSHLIRIYLYKVGANYNSNSDTRWKIRTNHAFEGLIRQMMLTSAILSSDADSLRIWCKWVRRVTQLYALIELCTKQEMCTVHASDSLASDT